MQYPLELTGLRSLIPAPRRWSFNACHRPGLLLVCLLVFGGLPERSDCDELLHSKQAYDVVLFTGSDRGNPFWELFAEFMHVAANDLGFNLEVFYADGSRKQMARQIRDVCRRSDKPDAIVVHCFKLNGMKSLRIAHKYAVPVFLVNSGLTEEQKKTIGEPRSIVKSWIGEMMPDDSRAGYQLANALIDQALEDPKRLMPDGKVHVIGLNGVVSDGASIHRVAGLKKAIDERSDVATLDQVVAADWEQELAHFRCKVLHRRYPHASVIWCASDRMSAGAIEAMQDRELIPGKDVIIGGVDATPEAMKLINEGQMSATIGGHFMDGGWVAVLLYDFFHGVDLTKIPTRSDSPMTLVTRDNLSMYQAALDKSTWEQIDFHQFSQHDHPELKTYEFGISTLKAVIQPELPPTDTNENDASKIEDREDR